MPSATVRPHGERRQTPAFLSALIFSLSRPVLVRVLHLPHHARATAALYIDSTRHNRAGLGAVREIGTDL